MPRVKKIKAISKKKPSAHSKKARAGRKTLARKRTTKNKSKSLANFANEISGPILLRDNNAHAYKISLRDEGDDKISAGIIRQSIRRGMLRNFMRETLIPRLTNNFEHPWVSIGDYGEIKMQNRNNGENSPSQENSIAGFADFNSKNFPAPPVAPVKFAALLKDGPTGTGFCQEPPIKQNSLQAVLPPKKSDFPSRPVLYGVTHKKHKDAKIQWQNNLSETVLYSILGVLVFAGALSIILCVLATPAGPIYNFKAIIKLDYQQIVGLFNKTASGLLNGIEDLGDFLKAFFRVGII